MIQQSRVFSAMLSLREFTVRDLAEASGAAEQTVRTTLARYGAVCHEVEREKTGKRGGAWIRYRLRPEGVDWLRARLADTQLDPPAPPTPLLVAEQLLMDLPREQDEEERGRTLRRARRLMRAIDAEPATQEPKPAGERAQPSPSHEVRMTALQLLLNLAETEVAAADDLDTSTTWASLLVQLLSRRSDTAQIEGGTFHNAIINRFLSSSLAIPEVCAIIRLSQSGALASRIDASLRGVAGQLARLSPHASIVGESTPPASVDLELSLLRLLVGAQVANIDLLMAISGSKWTVDALEGMPDKVVASPFELGGMAGIVLAGIEREVGISFGAQRTAGYELAPTVPPETTELEAYSLSGAAGGSAAALPSTARWVRIQTGVDQPGGLDVETIRASFEHVTPLRVRASERMVSVLGPSQTADFIYNDEAHVEKVHLASKMRVKLMAPPRGSGIRP